MKTLSQPHVLVYPEGDQYPKIIGIEWRSGATGTVGIVAVQRSETKWRAYIGVSKIHDLKVSDLKDTQAVSLKKAGGNTEKADAIEIMNWGTKLTEKEALAFFPDLKKKYGLDYLQD